MTQEELAAAFLELWASVNVPVSSVIQHAESEAPGNQAVEFPGIQCVQCVIITFLCFRSGGCCRLGFSLGTVVLVAFS